MKIKKLVTLLVFGALGIWATTRWQGHGERMQGADDTPDLGPLATRQALIQDRGPTTHPPRPASPPEDENFSDLPGAEAAGRESIDVALTEARHRVSPMPPEAAAGDNAGTLHHACNPAQGLVARFLSKGLRITPPGDVHAWQVTLSRRTPAGTAPVLESHGSKVEYHHADGVVEWWNNESGGFRQGFVVPATLQEHGEVRIAIRLEGMTADADPDRPGDLRFLQQPGIPLLGYRDLKAWDARQRPLQARMNATADGLELVALTSGAVFPVTIDPLVVRDPSILQGPVTDTGNVVGSRFGSTIASDGSRLMVRAGADFDPAGRCFGKVYTFKNEAGIWSFESQLIPPAALLTDATGEFGSSIAIHGNTAVVGNPISFSKGQVHVYEFSGSSWQHVTRFQRADGLSPFDSSADFGRAVAVWGDVIVAGDPSAKPPSMETEGMVFAYRKTNGQWVDDGRLAPPAGPLPYALGQSLALQDGRAFVGADRAVHIFERTPAGWSQTERLTAPAFAEFPFGAPLAVSGETLAVGTTDLFGNSNGAVHLFRQEAGAWNHQARLAVQGGPSSLGEEKSFGDSIALSGDLCLVGATRLVPPGIADYGAVIAFTCTGGVWTREADLFAATGTGESVALAGGFAFVGDDNNAASAPGVIPNAGLVSVSRVTSPCPVIRVRSAGKLLKPNNTFRVPAASPGHPTTVDLVLENAGASLLADFRLELTGPDAADFECIAPQARELMSGATSSIRVRFSPADPGTRTAELRIHSNDCAGPFRLPLSGSSGSFPEISLEHLGHGPLPDGSGQVDFGVTGSGDESTATFRVSNLGTGPLSKLSRKISGPAARDYHISKLPSSLPPGGTWDFTIIFRPLAAGNRPAVLQLFSSDSDESPFEIPLTGQGVARPEIEVRSGKTLLQDGSASLDFGTPAAGKRVTRKLTVRNTGWLPLQNLAFSLTGDTAGFALAPVTLGSIAPGKSLGLTLTCTGPASGLNVATLVIASNDADESPFEIELRAGTAPAAATARATGDAVGLQLPPSLAAAPAGDADGDGVGALLEFAFGLDPGEADHAILTPGRTTGLPRISMASANGHLSLRFEFVRRRDGLLKYQPQVTSDLTNFEAVSGPERITIIDADWERVIVDAPVPVERPDRLFGRVKVTSR